MSAKARFLDVDHYKVVSPIGDGTFTKVYKIESKDTGDLLAGKAFVFSIKDDIKSSDVKSVLKKVTSYSTLRHPSVLEFVGLSKTNFDNENFPTYVSEYISNGTLRSLIDSQKLNRSPEEWNDTKKLINVYAIASGMAFLHSHKILHQNLIPGNIMMDDYLFPKIKDYGLSILREILAIPNLENFKGDPTYMAPEVIDGEPCSMSSDVYSFGILAYEILTNETPEFDFDIDGLKLQFKEDLPEIYRELFGKCLSSAPEDRPSFDDITEMLKTQKGFITDGVNESEFHDFVNFVDEYMITDPKNPLQIEDYLKEHGKNKTIKKVVIEINNEEQQQEDESETKSQEESENSKEESEECNEEELLMTIHTTLQLTTQKRIKEELAEAMRHDNDQVEITEEEEDDEKETTKKKHQHQQQKQPTKEQQQPEAKEHKGKRTVKSIYPPALVKKLSKKCQNLVIDACSDYEKQFILGKYLIEGMNGFPQNLPLGFKYLNHSRKRNVIDAQCYFIYLLIKGKAVPQNIEEAKIQIDRIKMTNDSQIYALNGLLALVDNNLNEAKDLFEEGSILGDSESMYQYGKMLFLGKGAKKNKKESIEYLNKAAMDGHQKSEDFLTAYQLLYSRKGFKNLPVGPQYFFISNIMNNYLKNRELLDNEDSIRLDHIRITPIESEKIITRNLMKTYNFQQFLMSFQEVSIEAKYPSQLFKQFIDLFGKIMKKKPKNVQFGIVITDFSQELEQLCKSLNVSYLALDNTIQSIPEKAFFGFSSVTSIFIPSSVKEIGDSAFEGCTMLKNVEIPPSCILIGKSAFKGCNSLTEIIIPSSVVEIGTAAFKECSSLIQIFLPSSVKVIGELTFSQCSALAQVTLPDSIDKLLYSTFSDCPSLVELDIPSSVTTFGSKVFENCSQLTRIKIPSSVTSIGDSVFEGCSALSMIDLPNSLKKIGDSSFKACTSLCNIKIPSSLKKIASSLFLGCTALIDVTFHKSINKLGSRAFKGCTSLAHIKLPSSCSNLGEAVFEGCTALSQVKLPSSLTKLSKSAFLGCSSLSQINLPSSLNEIDDSAFKECIILSQITIPNSVTKIGSYVFSGCSELSKVNLSSSLVDIGLSCFEKCSAIKEITIPSTVVSIGGFGFFHCTSLSKIHFEEPTSLNQIRMSCFDECISLSAIDIPTTVAKIGESAFNGCTALEEISFPKSCKYIEDNAFNGCVSLADVSIEPQMKEIKDNAFKGCTALSQVTIPSKLTNVSKIAFPPKIRIKVGK